MTEQVRGCYRIPATDGLSDAARVEAAPFMVTVPEAIYRARGIKPPFEELPSRKDYDASKALGDSVDPKHPGHSNTNNQSD